MDYNRKKRRKAKSVQDMVGLGMMDRPVRKSNYQGPYNRGGSIEGSAGAGRSPRFDYTPSSRSGGFQEYAWIIYSVVLIICIVVAIVVFSTKTKKSSYTYPLDVVTMTGVLNTIYEEQATAGSVGGGAADSTDSEVGIPTADGTQSDAIKTDGLQADGTTVEPNASSATSGAVMVLDSGQEVAGYAQATSHTELLAELEGALAAGDSAFVGSKLAYKDETTGELTGYPQSVVEHFTTYMAGNADKRTSFIQDIQDESKYSAQNGTAYVVVLPMMRFTVNINYDNTTLTVSGFTDQVVNAGQSAIISPLLPCVYTVTVVNDSWQVHTVSSDVEADIKEGNLVLNI